MSSEPLHRARPDQDTNALHLFLWLVVGAVGWTVSGYAAGQHGVLLVMSILSMVLGGWYFWFDGGGRRITPVGVYSFAFGLFAGYAGVYVHGYVSPAYDITYLAVAAVALYFSQVLTVCGLPHTVEVPRSGTDSVEVARWGVALGVVLTVVGVLGSIAGLSFSGLVDAIAFAGVTIVAVSLFRLRGRIGPVKIIATAVGFAAYVLFVFNGFGRLSIGALGIAIVLAADGGRRISARTLKLVTLAGSVPTLTILAHSRVAFTSHLNPNQGSDVTGMESVVSPFMRFAQLMSARDTPPLRHGESFLASAAIFVPRPLWPGKPIGMGAELAHYFRPDLDGTGHSELALFNGEWFYNFGAVGLLLMVVVTRIALKRLNQWQVHLAQQSWTTPTALLLDVLLVLVVSGLPDLYWGGTFTFMSRTGFRVVGVVVLAAVLPRPQPGAHTRKLAGGSAETRSVAPARRTPEWPGQVARRHELVRRSR